MAENNSTHASLISTCARPLANQSCERGQHQINLKFSRSSSKPTNISQTNPTTSHANAHTLTRTSGVSSKCMLQIEFTVCRPRNNFRSVGQSSDSRHLRFHFICCSAVGKKTRESERNFIKTTKLKSSTGQHKMLRANRPILAFFDSIKGLRVRQLALILKAGYDPNLLVNARGQNGLQFLINYFGATDAHYRLAAPINKSAYLSIAKLLLDSGLDANAMDLLSDETVLFDAIRYNDKEMVALLLNYVDPALRNKSGETALMCAARFGTKQVTRLMLDHLRHLELDGYFLRQRNRYGLTPLEIARSENLEAARVLAKHLIAYGPGGHHGVPAGVLARSVSHHQLAAAAAAAGPVGRARRHPRMDALALAGVDPLVDCLSASDFEDDIDTAVPVRGGGGGHRAGIATGYHATQAGLYDPKAAEFSQYLLDQQAAMDSGEAGVYAGGSRGLSSNAAGSQRRQSNAHALSVDEDDYGAGQVAGGPLVRSRSCMLGPGATSSSKAYGAPTGSKKGGESGKMSTNWQDQSSGAGQ